MASNPAGKPATEPDVLTLPDAAAWRSWLDEHEDDESGVWLLLAKKGVTSPTALSYAAALDEALCSGWIDGQSKRVDDATFRQRFTPRRARSIWSKRNVEHVARLVAERRMRPRGAAEVARAQADGRWERAYAGSATIEIPAELAEALAANRAAASAFSALNAQNRYAILHRIVTAPSEATRTRRTAKYVAMLEAGQTPYPQSTRIG